MRQPTESESFQLMAEYSSDVLCRITADMQCRYCSPSSLRVLGWEPDEMLARFPGELIHPEDARRVRATYHGAATHPEKPAECGPAPRPAIFRVRKKDGSYTWMEVNSSLILDAITRTPWQILLNMRDVSERVVAEQRLVSLAMTDPLTELPNRRAFTEALDQEWRRARRDEGELSLLMLDVDNFKGINDRYGHAVGDHCLRSIGATLAGLGRRPGDIAARYGGEEFVLILAETGSYGAATVAEQLRRQIQALALPHGGNPSHNSVVTVSIGVATATLGPNGPSITPESLLKAADVALYKAKRQGRNRVESESLVQLSR